MLSGGAQPFHDESRIRSALQIAHLGFVIEMPQINGAESEIGDDFCSPRNSPGRDMFESLKEWSMISAQENDADNCHLRHQKATNDLCRSEAL